MTTNFRKSYIAQRVRENTQLSFKKEKHLKVKLFFLFTIVLSSYPSLSTAAEQTIIMDSFDGSIINSLYWDAYGRNVIQANGWISIEENATDTYSRIETKPFLASNIIKVRLVHQLHQGGTSNFMPSVSFIRNDGSSKTVVSALRWQKTSFGPDYCNISNGYNKIIAKDQNKCIISKLISSDYYDKWITSYITYNSATGRLDYDLGGDNRIDFTAQLSPSKQPINQVAINAYGWYTGHRHQLQSATILTNAVDDFGDVPSRNSLINPLIGVNSTTAGKINYQGDSDYFRVEIEAAGNLKISTTGTTRTYGYLYNSEGLELAHTPAMWSAVNFELTRAVTPGTYYVRVRHQLPSGIGVYNLVSQFTTPDDQPKRAVLLLHGMNSDTTTWQNLINSRWSGQCHTIYNGVIQEEATTLPTDTLNAVCYNLQFGRYDVEGSSGLEKITCSDTNIMGCHGDFTNIFVPTSGVNDLGVEVNAAIKAILSRMGWDAQIVLLAHSRGGLAARAMVERPPTSSNKGERSAVVGLITTGTPHQGSLLGRIYYYLKTNCLDRYGKRINSTNRGSKTEAIYKACEDDWEAVGLVGIKLDVRSPTIDYLSKDSSQIDALNNRTYFANWPANTNFTSIAYTGQWLGHFYSGYSAWDHIGAQAGDQFSDLSRNYALCGKVDTCTDRETDDEFLGDGLVIATDQFIANPRTNIPKVRYDDTTYFDGTYHVDEPDQIEDINAALRTIRWR